MNAGIIGKRCRPVIWLNNTVSEKGTGILCWCDPAKLFSICVLSLFFCLSFPLSITKLTQMFSAPGSSHFMLTSSVSTHFVTSILRKAYLMNWGISMYVLQCFQLTISVVAYFSKFSKSWLLDVIFSSRRTGFSPNVAMWDLGLTQWPGLGSFLSTFLIHCECFSSCTSLLLATASETKKAGTPVPRQVHATWIQLWQTGF